MYLRVFLCVLRSTMDGASEHATGNATEHAASSHQLHVGGIADSTATEHAVGTCTELGLLTDVVMANDDNPKTFPILEVAFKDEMWWAMPEDLSQMIYEQYEAGNNVSYTWDWEDTRKGSFKLDGQETNINRYTIDFDSMIQTNIDNNRKRSVRWVWICKDDVCPTWKGQIGNR